MNRVDSGKVAEVAEIATLQIVNDTEDLNYALNVASNILAHILVRYVRSHPAAQGFSLEDRVAGTVGVLRDATGMAEDLVKLLVVDDSPCLGET